LNILYIANARVPSEKAHPYQIIKMCESLKKNNVELTLILPFRFQTKKIKSAKKNIFDYYQVSKKFKIIKLPCIDFIWIDLYLEIPELVLHLAFYLQAFTFAISALIYVLFKKSDIIYSRDEFALFFLSFFKKKLYFEAHTFHKKGRKLYKLLLGKIDGLVVITNKLKELYIKEGIPEEKIIVAPDGVDLTMFSTFPSKEDARRDLGLSLNITIIGYVGRFHTMGMEKGIDILIKAHKIIKKKEKNAILCLVGGPKEAIPKYRRIAKNEGLAKEDIIFIDHVYPYKVPLYIHAFDVCVMPFPWNTYYAYYISPLKLFEYMASKRPIVATDLPSVREILIDGENAILVEPNNPKALAEGVEKVLENEKIAKKIAENAYMDVLQYTWDKRAENILEFIFRGKGE